jgi:hypothetical protein
MGRKSERENLYRERDRELPVGDFLTEREFFPQHSCTGKHKEGTSRSHVLIQFGFIVRG